MNTERDLLVRLLNLFPASLGKDQVGSPKSKFEKVERMVDGMRKSDLLNLAESNFFMTKQNIFLLDREVKMQVLTEVLGNDHVVSSDKTSITFFQQVKYFVTTLNSPQTEVFFLRPVQVKTWKKGFTTIHYTIVERDIDRYVEGDEIEILNSRRAINDQHIMRHILMISPGCNVVDVHKGIKSLWRDNLIDGLIVRFRNTSSLREERMDMDYTFKQKYPDEFEYVMSRPLTSNLFKSLKTDYLCDFYCNPSNGYLSLKRFQKDPQLLMNVINEIFERNA